MYGQIPGVKYSASYINIAGITPAIIVYHAEYFTPDICPYIGIFM
jgi:hypothetical protein